MGVPGAEKPSEIIMGLQRARLLKMAELMGPPAPRYFLPPSELPFEYLKDPAIDGGTLTRMHCIYRVPLKGLPCWYCLWSYRLTYSVPSSSSSEETAPRTLDFGVVFSAEVVEIHTVRCTLEKHAHSSDPVISGTVWWHGCDRSALSSIQLSFLCFRLTFPTPRDVVKKVFDHTLKFKGVLGKGSFGVVGGFDDILSGKQLAVKTFNDALSWWKELCILGTISRSVKRSVWLERAGMFWDGGICYWWLAMPILHPLPTRVCQRDPNALDKLLWRMFATLLEGVAQLQHPSSLESNSGGCVHADIKPGNLLWDHSSQNLAVMLADFSLTTAAPQTLGRRFGTRFWRAPEVEDLTLNRTEVGWFQKTDVWSCGLVMLHMVLGGTRGPIRSLVHTHLELKEDEKPESEDIVRITKEHLPALLEDAKKQLVASLVPCPLKLWNHINHALSIDPVQRPSAADLFASVRESYLYVIRNIYTKKPDECLLSPSKRPAPSRRRSTRKRRIVCA